ncbi:hypothetical protein JTB14_014990 [Gonioctena quinquepunctata]|nr:hypothetical protein JTB14_014990 [Gonioctena quinquepunctata]
MPLRALHGPGGFAISKSIGQSETVWLDCLSRCFHNRTWLSARPHRCRESAHLPCPVRIRFSLDQMERGRVEPLAEVQDCLFGCSQILL